MTDYDISNNSLDKRAIDNYLIMKTLIKHRKLDLISYLSKTKDRKQV